MDGKTKAIVAHLWIIGWIIAFVLNSQKKDQIASFYIRQMLGFMLMGIVLSFLYRIPVINLFGLLIGIVLFVFWILSLVGAVNNEEKLTPVVGEYFQEWFKNIS